MQLLNFYLTFDLDIQYIILLYLNFYVLSEFYLLLNLNLKYYNYYQDYFTFHQIELEKPVLLLTYYLVRELPESFAYPKNDPISL